MKKISTLFLIALVFSGCGSSKFFKVAEVRSIEFEYDTNADLNYGGLLKATPYALLLNGDKVDISKNRKFKFFSQGLKKTSSKTHYSVVKKPSGFSDDTLKIQLLLTDKNETFSVTKSILLNYRGTLNVNLNGRNGSKGENKKNRGSTYILRNGKDGENGANGQNAKNVLGYNLYNWKENEFYYFYIISADSSEILTYKSADKNGLTIQLNGGKGGNGGNGGNGKDGKLTSKGKSIIPGKGGDGGNSGNGGNGGNGGNLTVFIHRNTSGIEPSIVLFNKGGRGGNPGKFGKAGKPGNPLEGQKLGVSGVNGTIGKRGRNGVNGLPTSAVVVSFDFTRYL